MSGTIYMIPVTLGGSGFNSTIPLQVQEKTLSLRIFAVEEIRTARRYLRMIDKTFPIDETQFFEIGKHALPEELSQFFSKVEQGDDAGVMSEAGMPGIADPGALVAYEAHTRGIKVIPLTGPSSVMLGIAASGFNGQSFAFNGYLPVVQSERTKALKELEKKVMTGQTQIFIETPFRNEKMFSDIIISCSPSSMLCIACDITMDSESIVTKSISDWKKSKPGLNGRQVVFLLGKSENRILSKITKK